MYRPQWEPADLMKLLSAALENDERLRAADTILCAQPMPLCSLLRPLADLPMLIYQAFPLIGATPATLRHLCSCISEKWHKHPEDPPLLHIPNFSQHSSRTKWASDHCA